MRGWRYPLVSNLCGSHLHSGVHCVEEHELVILFGTLLLHRLNVYIHVIWHKTRR